MKDNKLFKFKIDQNKLILSIIIHSNMLTIHENINTIYNILINKCDDHTFKYVFIIETRYIGQTYFNTKIIDRYKAFNKDTDYKIFSNNVIEALNTYVNDNIILESYIKINISALNINTIKILIKECDKHTIQPRYKTDNKHNIDIQIKTLHKYILDQIKTYDE